MQHQVLQGGCFDFSIRLGLELSKDIDKASLLTMALPVQLIKIVSNPSDNFKMDAT